eukprot:CAMPEP_0172545780 /NCGR_PEP_ID=MMETSP1067-20121228/15645_1 /TAXON_ID=265564 ORGANISM="Thalassiosira punctigera, Strain Tpunct2005C2" /NCGR_SAMPLE_ID=MMETSP1067 /ASSEMBLY_ACC=CAM_ASM_000444 /LENGTH=426 /DNA_ID=CAMNT_0013332595 /DNA_START=168 /DNA_END=1448 /DNA_ORIENTATION=-
MFVADLLRGAFANKLVDDDRIDRPAFAFGVPLPGGGGAACGFLPPDLAFYSQLVVVIAIQSCFNAMLGSLVYKMLVEPPTKAKEKVIRVTSSSSARFLFAYGFAIPMVVMEPIYMLNFLDIQNAGLRMTFLASPIVNSLRILEALHGHAPAAAGRSLYNYVVYFSCAFGISFDPVTLEPKRASFEFITKRFKTIGRDFVIGSFIISILHQYDYEFFDTRLPPHSSEHTLADLVSWRHLLNNFFVAVLISTSLSQSSLGVSLLYNAFYRYETYEIVLNPMFRSTSPSEFWGRRWNTLVHRGLKNGVYKPARSRTSSKMLAVLATFAVSGVIHEFVNHVMFANRASYRFGWKQMLFFGWNGVLIAMEYCIGGWGVFEWMSRTLPRPLITALVLCAALPLAHLFTGDWIKHGYLDAVYLAEPVIACRRV